MVLASDVRKDRLGQELEVDDVVAAVQSNELIIGKIIKITPKMVTLAKLGKLKQYEKTKISAYSNNMVKIDPNAVTMFCLTKG